MTEFEEKMLRIQKERNRILKERNKTLEELRETTFDGFDTIKEAFYRIFGSEGVLLETLRRGWS